LRANDRRTQRDPSLLVQSSLARDPVRQLDSIQDAHIAASVPW